MKKYRIMLIDDEFKSRKDSRKESVIKYFCNDWIKNNSNIKNKDNILELLPTEFELVFASTWEEFEDVYERYEIHAFCIDFLLATNDRIRESGDFDEKSLNNILHKIKEKKENTPILIYSSSWTGDRISEVLNSFKIVFGNRVPNQIMTYDDFVNTIKDLRLNEVKLNEAKLKKLEREREHIWNMIAKSKEQICVRPFSTSGDIAILHISDLQYGDRKISGNIMGIWKDMYKAIHDYLSKKNMEKIDIIIITGDVAMCGKKDEYNEALKELPKLFEQIWGKNYSPDRIILVPGNHDFDINTCVLEYFKAKNIEGERKVDFNSVIKQIGEHKKMGEYNELGLYEFRRFSYQLTKNDQYILSNNLNFVIDRFNNWGLRFLCLNTLDGITADKTNHVGINYEELENIANEPEKENDLLTIALAHHTLLSEDLLSKAENEEIKKRYDALLRSMGAKIVMGGHRHVNDTGSISNSANNSMENIEAASLRIEENEEKYVRGFGVIIINDALSEMDLQYFNFDKCDGAIKLEPIRNYKLREV